MRNLDNQLNSLLQKIVMMGSLAEEMIQLAVERLEKRSETPSREIEEKEQQVNALQVEVDDLAVRLTVRQQPVAQDARFLFMASRIAGELERIADQAVNISENTQYVLDSPPLRSAMPSAGLVDIPIMAGLAQQMVRESLGAMMKRDVHLAGQVLEEDQKVDALRDQVFRSLLTYMMADTSSLQRALSLILISRNLERIGDHATNIAEEVIYWLKGRDVRHGKGLEPEAEKQQP